MSNPISQIKGDLDPGFLKAFFNAMPDPVVITTKERTIMAVNEAFCETFGYSESELSGANTSILYAEKNEYEETGKSIAYPESLSKSIRHKLTFKRKDGETFTGETEGNVVKNSNGEVLGFLGIINDFSSVQNDKSELNILSERLKLLVQVMVGGRHGTDDQIQKAISLTTRMLGLEVAIISRIENEQYTIEYFYPEESGLEIGMQFELGETYCNITMDADDVVMIDHMKTSSYATHPCYEKFNLESYVGVPIQVDGERYGTLNFSSTQPREDNFTGVDKDLLWLLGEWVGTSLESKIVNKRLKESQHKYKLISEMSVDMICLHDTKGNFEFVSPSSKQLLGYTPEELVETSPYDLFHPEDRDGVMNGSYAKAISGEQVQRTEYRIRRKNGEYLWFETGAEPLKNSEGEVVKIWSGSRDITERKKLELLLKETNKLATVGGWEYEIDSGELFWTDEVYNIHEEPIGSEVKVDEGLSYYPPESLPIITGCLDRAIKEKEPYDVELALITAKGNRKWVRAVGNASVDSNGRVTRLYGAFMDLTERKKMEDQIRERNDQLEKLNRTTSKINSIIGHDLKTPLSAIIGFSELILLDDPNNTSKTQLLERIQMINQASVNMSNLLTNLLQWSKNQTGEMSLVITEMNIAHAIDHVIELIIPTASKKGVDIKFEPPEISSIQADEQIVTTIIRNFVSNAVKFSNKGGLVDIKVETGDTSLIIKVVDGGVGMPDSIKSKLFTNDQNNRRSGTDNELGSGMGLFLCRELAELHGGGISAVSEEGQGTEMILKIPLAVK